jgi:hypothetical protein
MSSMHDPDLEDELPVRPVRPRRRLKIALLVLLLPAGLLGGGYLYLVLAANGELEAAQEEASRDDPHWRLEEIEARRKEIPDAQNAALRVLAVQRLIPQSWPPPQLTELFIEDPAPQEQLNEPQIAALRKELARAQPALTRARTLTDLPRGRYPVTYSLDYISTRVRCQEARAVADLLSWDVRLRTQEQDLDGALRTCHALLNTARSIGDDPMVIGQLVRIACRAVALSGIERVLAQGEPSEAALENLQRLLAQEDLVPLFLITARGERAGMDRLMRAIQEGDIDISSRQFQLILDFDGRPGGGPSFLEGLTWRLPPNRKSQRAALLRWNNEIVAIARLPLQDQRPRLVDLEKTLREQPLFVRVFAPATSRVVEAFHRELARVRCTMAALAAERYRRRHQRWPDSLAALVPALLPGVPADPFDGKPLRMRRLADGVVIYSVGPDGEDNGGNLPRNAPLGRGVDVGIRLWDVARRRQPAKPPPEKPAPLQGGPRGRAPGPGRAGAQGKN